MARPRGSKNKGQRTRYSAETKQVMAAMIAEFGASKTQRILQKTLKDATPSIATLCKVAASHKVALSRGPEMDLDDRDVLAALINEVGLTGAQSALSSIVIGNKPAMKVPSLVTLSKIADEYGIKLTRGRKAA